MLEERTTNDARPAKIPKIIVKAYYAQMNCESWCGVCTLPLMLFVILFVCLILIWINFMSCCCCTYWNVTFNYSIHIVKVGSLWLQWIMSSFIFEPFNNINTWNIYHHQRIYRTREIEFEKNVWLWPNAACLLSSVTRTFNVRSSLAHMFSWTLIFDNPINQVKIILNYESSIYCVVSSFNSKLSFFHSHELNFYLTNFHSHSGRWQHTTHDWN